MKIMHTMASEANASRPQRRFYSPELKVQVTQECRQSGASVAGVALSHGINANIVHRWLREHSRTALVPQSQAFVPVTLDEPAPGSAPQAAPDIRVEVQRAGIFGEHKLSGRALGPVASSVDPPRCNTD